MTAKQVLDDLLDEGMLAVFCGTAAGTASAERGQYYTGRGSRFWKILHETGLTSGADPLKPEEWPRLRDFGLGLTDLAKRHSGADSDLPASSFEPDRLRVEVRRLQPRTLANGLKAASVFLGRPAAYGMQGDTIGETSIWVLPSTSGAVNGHWDAPFWHLTAASLKSDPVPGL